MHPSHAFLATVCKTLAFLATVLATVHHSHAFFSNRSDFSKKKKKYFLFFEKSEQLLKNAWEWCTVAKTSAKKRKGFAHGCSKARGRGEFFK